MCSVRTVLLDLDGTLVDSAALITEHLAAAIAAAGAPAPRPAQLRGLVGPPFETALPELGLTAEQTTATIAAYRGTYDAVAATHTPLYPGVPALLDDLRDAGLRLAVATSKPEHLARRIVDGVGLGGAFALVGGADHPAGRVGKARVVESVLARLALDPTRDAVVMVGDRHHDVDGAAAHGVPTIGVAWGYAEPGELARAVVVVPDIEALRTVLTGDDIWSAASPAA
ncbi:MAG: phosphoglycolate phosphatase [Pseudonocardiales bacterium]|jgi:phosphoglycolate phosphatase|nr:phosphoglycolate phosphatase [Pseudonocardiales bacterium]